MNSRELIADYVAKYCIQRLPPDSEFMLGKLPGTRYSRQYYLSSLLYDQRMMQEVTEEFHRLVVHNLRTFDFQLAGREWSSIPLLTTLPAMMYNTYNIRLNSFMIKRERKTYGTHSFIEGRPTKQKVLLVDDVCNSTNAFWHCDRVVRQELGLETVPHIFAVVNKFRPSKGHPYQFDRYLFSHQTMTIITGDEVNWS